MPFNTILVHIDDSPYLARRVDVAAALAPPGGHLIGAAATGVSRFLYHSMPPEQDDPTLALHLDMLREQARTALASFSQRCGELGVASFEERIVDDDTAAGISLHARAADLVVVGQAEPDGKPANAEIPTAVITHAGRPVLVVPWAGGLAGAGQHILVSWDGGREAARAMQLALPLLKAARSVSIAVFEMPATAHTAADALAADPRPWLARHGIEAELSVHAVEHHMRLSRRHEVGERLLSLATERGHDMLVMGAHGHSRLRESLLGGVTRTVLASMTVPVLMAH
ncbi:universal stress protein [Massilia sp. PAMC28688]|uniref:universal stress protein n=1 Tax=Massilia sp. PAMC28688 TaxID=2861283 RepID=UPI001C629D15|nr:universal stress protein [Massilia sp. PAMC28688]QYF93808.1 universal stress protein [Massilia sp. PAMC28688]